MTSDYFVRIQDPALVRIALLESSKNIVHSLQRYHRVLMIRKHKLEQVAILKSQIKEVHLLMQKVEGLLPKEHLPDEAYDRSKEHVVPTKKKIHAHPKKAHASKEEVAEHKMDQLNKTLEAIEKRLESMN